MKQKKFLPKGNLTKDEYDLAILLATHDVRFAIQFYELLCKRPNEVCFGNVKNEIFQMMALSEIEFWVRN